MDDFQAAEWRSMVKEAYSAPAPKVESLAEYDKYQQEARDITAKMAKKIENHLVTATARDKTGNEIARFSCWANKRPKEVWFDPELCDTLTPEEFSSQMAKGLRKATA